MRAQGELPTVERLLLEVYAGVQEPDGLYGAARSPARACQLRLAEHEGAWGAAAVGYDLLARASGGARARRSNFPRMLGFACKQ